jgi:mono/diheme cytochrome c family protein
MKKSMIAAAAILVVAAVSASAQDGKALYTKSCQKCHGAEGKGDTAMGKKLGAKDYSDAKVQDALKDDAAFKAVKEGLKKDDKTLMQPFADLSDADIKAIVAYLRTLKK